VILRAARSEHATGWLFVAPAVLLIGIFGVIPIGWSLILSFQHNDLLSPPTWVGLDNYKALKDDPVFTDSVKRTIVYTVLFVPLSVGGALVIALALNAPLRLGTYSALLAQPEELGFTRWSGREDEGDIGWSSGVGINEADTSLRFIQAGDFDCMLLAGRYTLLEQGGLEEFLPECVKRSVSVILGGPYNSGILTGGVKPGATHDYVAAPAPLIEKAQKIEAVCQRHGVELGAAAMQFPLFHPALCSVIPGALSSAEVKQNIARLSARIPVELWSELKREKLLDPAAPTPN